MEKKTCNIFTLLFILFVCCSNYAQPYYPQVNKTCSVVSTSATICTTGTVKALIIYFKFRDDYFDLYPYTNDWDEDQLHNDALPTWAYDVLSPTVQSLYTNPSLSGYFHNMSFGNFELIGDEYPNNDTPYVSENDVSWYYSPRCQGSRHLSYAVYEALTQLDNQIDYNDYDSDQDGYVDLIIMWFRFHNSGCTSSGAFSGIGDLRANNPNGYFVPGVIEITTGEGTKIRGSSGVVIEATSSRYVNIIAHEIGHLMGLATMRGRGITA
jgi:M6 family metalloprotease-like protein